MTEADETPEQIEAEDRLFDVLERPWLTVSMVLAQLGAYLAVGAIPFARGNTDLLGILIRPRGPGLLKRTGAMFGPRVDRGELWRLVSSCWLHGGWLHMLVNALALFALGRLCEALYGPGRMLLLFLGSGVGGAALSWVLGTELTVGASGGVFGLMGAAIVFGWRHGDALPDGPVRFLRWRLLPWLLVNLALGFALPNIIDNAGHVGGLITGAVMATVMGNRIAAGEDGTATSRALTWATSAVLLAGGAWGVAGMWT